MSYKHQPIQGGESDDFEHHKPEQYELTCYESCIVCCGDCAGCLNMWCPCICCCTKSPVYQVQTAKLGVHQSFGRFKQILQPGFHLVNPYSENVIDVDMKTNVFELPPQQVISKDNVSMRINTIVFYRAIQPYKLVYKLRNDTGRIRQFIKEMAYSALRSVIGDIIFQDLFQKRQSMSVELLKYVKEKTYPWGLFIENIFIKDVILQAETQKNMQSAAIQKRLSEATIIEAQANVEAAKMLKETSEILNSTSAMQIRYLQAIQNMTSTCGSKVLFMNMKGKE